MGGRARARLRTSAYCVGVVVASAVYFGGYGYLIWRGSLWLESLFSYAK